MARFGSGLRDEKARVRWVKIGVIQSLKIMKMCEMCIIFLTFILIATKKVKSI